MLPTALWVVVVAAAGAVVCVVADSAPVRRPSPQLRLLALAHAGVDVEARNEYGQVCSSL